MADQSSSTFDRQMPPGWVPVSLHLLARVCSEESAPDMMAVRTGDILVSRTDVRIVLESSGVTQVTSEFVPLALNTGGTIPCDPQCLAHLFRSDLVRRQFSPWNDILSVQLEAARAQLQIRFPFPATLADQQQFVLKIQPVLDELDGLCRAVSQYAAEAKRFHDSILDERFRTFETYRLIPLTYLCTVISPSGDEVVTEPGDVVLGPDMFTHRKLHEELSARTVPPEHVILRPHKPLEKGTLFSAWWLALKFRRTHDYDGWKRLREEGWHALRVPDVSPTVCDRLVSDLKESSDHLAAIRALQDEQMRTLDDLLQATLGDLSEGALSV